MVICETSTACTAFLDLYAHAGVTHSIRVGESRDIRTIDSGKYLSLATSAHSFMCVFSVSNYPSKYPAKRVLSTRLNCSTVLSRCLPYAR